MVYQQFINYPSLTVYENIASPLRIARKLEAARSIARGRATAEIMSTSFLDRLPAQLSGGQQQRTAIARALVKACRSCCSTNRSSISTTSCARSCASSCRDIFAEPAVTVVYATTEPVEALMLGGYTAVLDAGRVLQFGTTIDVYPPAAIAAGGAPIFSDPPMNLCRYERAGGMARLPAEPLCRAGHMRRLGDGALPPRRPRESVALEREPRADLAVPASVELAEISGSETFVHARHDDLVSWCSRACIATSSAADRRSSRSATPLCLRRDRRAGSPRRRVPRGVP